MHSSGTVGSSETRHSSSSYCFSRRPAAVASRFRAARQAREFSRSLMDDLPFLLLGPIAASVATLRPKQHLRRGCIHRLVLERAHMCGHARACVLVMSRFATGCLWITPKM